MQGGAHSAPAPCTRLCHLRASGDVTATRFRARGHRPCTVQGHASVAPTGRCTPAVAQGCALSGACPQRLMCDAHSSPATKSCGVAMTGWTSSVSTNRPPPAPPLAEGSDKRRTGGAAVSLEWRREPPFAGGRGGPTAKNLDRIPLGGAWYRARAPVRCTREVCHHSKVLSRPARAPTSQGVPGSFRSAVGGARHFDG